MVVCVVKELHGVCMHGCMYVSICVGMYACIYMYMYVCMFVYVFVCMHVCMYARTVVKFGGISLLKKTLYPWKPCNAVQHSIYYKIIQKLTSLKLLLLMYWYKLQDMLFIIKCIKTPSDNFDIQKCISLVTCSTRSALHHKLKQKLYCTSHYRHFFFNNNNNNNNNVCTHYNNTRLVSCCVTKYYLIVTWSD